MGPHVTMNTLVEHEDMWGELYKQFNLKIYREKRYLLIDCTVVKIKCLVRFQVCARA